MADSNEQVPSAGGVAHEVLGYRIERELGRGSMGVVYLAEDVRLDRKVALKVLAPLFAHDERFRERFMRESRTAANLDHAHIVPIYSAGESGGLLYIAMRHIDGRDLRTLLETDGPMALERALAVVIQVGDALDAAHDRGLVHRDVKPANILLEHRRDQEHFYLCDFGITKDLSSGATQTAADQLLGTFDYISPEQVAGQPVDGRADVYALGCVLYQCLTGVVPFPRDGSVALLWAHMNEQPPPVTALRPDLPPEIDRIVAKAMAKKREDRYATCGELALALSALAAGVLGTPDGSGSAVPPVTTPIDDPASPIRSNSETSLYAAPGAQLRRRVTTTQLPGPRRWPLAAVGGAAALILVGVFAVVGVRESASRLSSGLPETMRRLPSSVAQASPSAAAELSPSGQAPHTFSEPCIGGDIAAQGCEPGQIASLPAPQALSVPLPESAPKVSSTPPSRSPLLLPAQPASGETTELHVPAPAAPEPDDASLDYVPASFRSTCGRSGDSVVECRPALGADQIRYVQFSDQRTMRRFYAPRIAPFVFKRGAGELSVYDHGGGNKGVLLMLTNTDGKPQIEWSNERLGIYAVAVGNDMHALVQAWRANEFGPR